MRQILTICVLVLSVTAAHAAAPTHRDEEVTFRSGSLTIAGTLSLPSGSGPFPAVVLLSGSGLQDRDSELFGFRPFKLIADAFVQRGIAVLRCDDRGVGGSTGSVAAATSEDFADDALAAVRMLRARAEIDGARVGLLGHSEGAIVAAIAASRTSDVAFIVWMAGSAVPGSEILRMQAASIARAAGATDSAVDEILRHHAAFMAAITEDAPDDTVMALGRTLAAAQLAAVPDTKQAAPADRTALVERLIAQNLAALRSPWLRFFIGFDPSTVLRRVACPVFAAFGGRDVQVAEAVNRARLEAALSDARNQQVTVRVYPEANHLFMQAVTGRLAEYATLPKAFVAPLLEDLAAWIARR
jgi:dienelactone hydrolase